MLVQRIHVPGLPVRARVLADLTDVDVTPLQGRDIGIVDFARSDVVACFIVDGFALVGAIDFETCLTEPGCQPQVVPDLRRHKHGTTKIHTH